MPPSWAQGLLALLLPARGRDGILGDLLEEYHEAQLAARGTAGANRWFVRQALGFLWRVSLPWGLLVSAILVGRGILDVAVPTSDFRLRAAVTTWTSISAFGAAGLYAGWRARRVLSGTAVGVFAGIMACVMGTLYALAAVLLARPTITGDAVAYRGLIEALDVPVVPLLILGTLAGTIGGGIGRGLSALSSGPRLSRRT
jgi:hypothetical protein